MEREVVSADQYASSMDKYMPLEPSSPVPKSARSVAPSDLLSKKRRPKPPAKRI
jgi:hypothetical protein